MNLTDAARLAIRGENSDPAVWHLLNSGSDDNGRKYYLLLSAVGQADLLRHVPDLLKGVIRNRAWEHWQWLGVEFSAPSLGSYLTSNPPKGVGATLPMVEKLIADDAEALAEFRKATTAGKGRKPKHITNGDNITINPERGTSRAYTLDRLEREQPDLFARVQRKELSANAAAIRAGFRPKLTKLEKVVRGYLRLSMEDRAEFHERIK